MVCSYQLRNQRIFLGFRLVEKQEEEKKTYKGQTGLLDFIKEKKKTFRERRSQKRPTRVKQRSDVAKLVF